MNILARCTMLGRREEPEEEFAISCCPLNWKTKITTNTSTSPIEIVFFLLEYLSFFTCFYSSFVSSLTRKCRSLTRKCMYSLPSSFHSIQCNSIKWLPGLLSRSLLQSPSFSIIIRELNPKFVNLEQNSWQLLYDDKIIDKTEIHESLSWSI